MTQSSMFTQINSQDPLGVARHFPGGYRELGPEEREAVRRDFVLQVDPEKGPESEAWKSEWAFLNFIRYRVPARRH